MFTNSSFLNKFHAMIVKFYLCFTSSFKTRLVHPRQRNYSMTVVPRQGFYAISTRSHNFPLRVAVFVARLGSSCFVMLSLSLVARLTRQFASPQSATPRGFFFPFDRLAWMLVETTTRNFRRGKCKRVENANLSVRGVLLLD